MLLLSLSASAVLALIHLGAGKLKFLEKTPRSIWLSLAGGISVAYVFLHLLPELAAGQEMVEKSAFGPFAFLKRDAYLLAFTGLTVFYGLERIAKQSRRNQQSQGKQDIASPQVFWIHTISFGIYNMLIGYLLIHETWAIEDLVFFSLAMALHFVVNDYGLREHFRHRYHNIGRWFLASAVLLGWLTGWFFEIPELATSLLTAFLAGGIILNVLKEELPEERQSRFSAFLCGGAAYAILLQAI